MRLSLRVDQSVRARFEKARAPLTLRHSSATHPPLASPGSTPKTEQAEPTCKAVTMTLCDPAARMSQIRLLPNSSCSGRVLARPAAPVWRLSAQTLEPDSPYTGHAAHRENRRCTGHARRSCSMFRPDQIVSELLAPNRPHSRVHFRTRSPHLSPFATPATQDSGRPPPHSPRPLQLESVDSVLFRSSVQDLPPPDSLQSHWDTSGEPVAARSRSQGLEEKYHN